MPACAIVYGILGMYKCMYYDVSILFHSYNNNCSLYDTDITIHNYSKCLTFNGVLIILFPECIEAVM